MNQQSQMTEADLIGGDRRNIRRRALYALGLLVLVTVAAVAGILIYAENERERLREQWQIRLGIVADSRAAAVEGWLQQRRAETLRLAQNRAIQFFLVDRADPEVPPEAVDARLRYVEDLLVNEAERTGYLKPELGDAANGGFILLDIDGSVIARTTAAPAVQTAAPDISRKDSLTVRVSPMFDGGGGVPMISVTAPVVPVEGLRGDPIGFITGFVRLEEDFFALLKQPGDISGQTLTELVQDEGDVLRVVSPGMAEAAGAQQGYARALSGQSAGAGLFVGPDGQQVLGVSRTIRDVPWTLVRLIDRDTALAGGERRIWSMAGVLVLAVLFAGVCVVAVWRNAVSHRLAAAASDLSAALGESDRLSKLLQRVTDAVPNGILAIGADNRVLFGNRAVLNQSGVDAEDAEGKDLIGLFGPGRAGPLLSANDRVRETGATLREVDDHSAGGVRQVTLRSHVPLDDRGILLVVEDMTEVVVEREARAAQLDSLVNVLVDLIDARDSYASHHSRRVAELAHRMAEQMDLPDAEVRAAETAARLMNLGKLKIDPSLLTKSEDLTSAERDRIRDQILDSADLVSGISFDGPVVETLRQLQERHDGSGRPKGLSGDDLLKTAQIVSLANTYIAMTSDRAHREAMTPEAALAQLWEAAGAAWSRQVIAALVQAVEAG